jgi:hypothetical protein
MNLAAEAEFGVFGRCDNARTGVSERSPDVIQGVSDG